MALRFLRTESFRLAAIFAALLLAAMLVLMALVYVIMHRAFRTELLAASAHDLVTLQKAYAGEGEPEAVEVAHQMLGKAADGEYLALESGAKRRLAGNLSDIAMKPGEQTIILPPAPDDRSETEMRRIIGRGVFIAPGLFAFAGRDLSAASDAEEEALHAFALVLLGALALALGGGIFASQTFLARMDRMTQTCRAIMAGELATRIPQRGTKDELDRLAATINAMLDRIGALMENVRQISNDIAHDLRTPLTTLRHRLEHARSEAQTRDDYEKAIDRAIADSNELLSVFSALLSIAQIESHAEPSRLQPTSLSDLLGELVDMYRPAAEDSGHPLTGSIEPSIAVQGNRRLLSQMFSNLIENAMTHTPEGTPVFVRLVRESGRAVASVADSGLGVPPAERDKVFRRFYRLEQARSRPGSGLGLALVSAIADFHHATISGRDCAPGWEVRIEFPL